MDYSIIDGIFSGKNDEALDAIVQAIKDRRNILAARMGDELSIGDKVVFNSKTSPKYMIGVTATVVRKKQKKIVVVIDEGQGDGNHGRFSAGVEINTSPSLLDVLVTN